MSYYTVIIFVYATILSSFINLAFPWLVGQGLAFVTPSDSLDTVNQEISGIKTRVEGSNIFHGNRKQAGLYAFFFMFCFFEIGLSWSGQFNQKVKYILYFCKR